LRSNGKPLGECRLNKGRNALVVDERSELIDVIGKLKTLIDEGGLDEVMEKAALNK